MGISLNAQNSILLKIIEISVWLHGKFGNFTHSAVFSATLRSLLAWISCIEGGNEIRDTTRDVWRREPKSFLCYCAAMLHVLELDVLCILPFH